MTEGSGKPPVTRWIQTTTEITFYGLDQPPIFLQWYNGSSSQGEHGWVANCWFKNFSWHTAGFVTVKPLSEIATYEIYASSQDRYCGYTCMEFTLESWTQFLPLMSVVYAWHLPEVDLNHCHHWNVTTCEQSTRSKLSCVLQPKLSPLWVTDHALWQYPFTYWVHELGIWPQASIYNIYIYIHTCTHMNTVQSR